MKLLSRILQHSNIFSHFQEEKILDEVYLKNINNSFNKHTNSATFEKKYFKNILLIGSTGYLGMHLLYELINTTSSKIICIIRNKKRIEIALFTDAMKRYVERKDRNSIRLHKYAKLFNIEDEIRKYLEVLL